MAAEYGPPKRVLAKITCTIEASAYVTLDRHGVVEEVIETDEIIDFRDVTLDHIKYVISTHE